VYFSVKHMAIIPQRTFKDGSEMYDDAIPLKERLPISEWFFQLWKRDVQDGEKDHGVKINVGDLEKLIVMEVANSEAKEIVFKAQQEVGGNAAKTFTVKPQDEAAFNALSYSSTGISSWIMVFDHAGVAELRNLKPVQIDVTTAGELPIVAWTFRHS